MNVVGWNTVRAELIRVRLLPFLLQFTNYIQAINMWASFVCFFHQIINYFIHSGRGCAQNINQKKICFLNAQSKQ